LESNGIMKRGILLCLLLLGMLSQLQVANAISETYTWHPPPGDHEAFDIYVETEDSWQTDVSMNVLVKVTLAAKHWSFDHVDIKWTKVEISALKFSMDSGEIAETASFRNIGEYYERRINFQVPSDKLNRGENVSLSIICSINIDIVDNVQWKHWIYTGSNSGNPLIVSLSRPVLSTLELIGIFVLAVIVVGGISGFIIYRRRITPAKPPSLPTQ